MPSSWAAPTFRAEPRIETLKVVLLAAAIIYAAIAGVVWLAQDSLVFYPPPAIRTPAPPSGWQVEDVALTVRDGTKLAGVLLRRPGASPSPLVIYFGGNAEEVTGYASDAPALYGERAVLLMNYRGYGASAGKPSETALVSLGVWDEIQDHLVRADNVRSAMTFVARGESPLGIVYATDALADSQVRIVDTFPENTHAPITYPGATIRGARAEAIAYLNYLASPAVRDTWRRFGFGEIEK